MSNVTVVMTTYAPEGEGSIRASYAKTSLVSLLACLKGASFRLHVSDDGSVERGYITTMIDGSQRVWHGSKGTSTNSKRKGIGASLNASIYLMDMLGEDLWLYTTDDWELTSFLDVAPAVQLIEQLGYDYVRLSPCHPNIMCATRFRQDIGWWLELFPKWGGYAFATRPFIASMAFYKAIGMFREECDSYVCERDYSDRVCEAAASVKLAQLDTGLGGPQWHHIGDYCVGATYP